MKRKVVITKTAKNKLDSLFNYLLENWSEKVKSEFVQKLDDSIEIIRNKPELFPESHKRKGLRRCVLTKQITLFYRFNNERIEIVTLFDTRQSPNKFK